MLGLMKSLSLLLMAASLTSNAAGYPVYGLLRQNTYKVTNGTAFLVRYGDRSYMITNWHVCDTFISSAVRNEAKRKSYPTVILKRSPNQDLCVVSTKESGGLEIGKDLGSKAPVYAAGYPQYSKTLQLRSGHTVQQEAESIDYGPIRCPKGFKKGAKVDPTSHQTVATCTHEQTIMSTTLEGTYGNSGSPVVNSRGRLVGIVHSSEEGTPNDDHHHSMCYIPASELVKLLSSLQTKRP